MTRPDQNRRPRRYLRRLATVCVFAVVALGAAALHGCDSMFYRPNATIYGSVEEYGDRAERVGFSAPGGPELDGLWLKAEGKQLGTVVYCHGNTGNLTLHAHYVDWLPRYGFNLLLFDYRGYGASEGEPTRAGTNADTLAAIDFALARDPEHTVVFGHSLGAAIGVFAVGERPAVRAVVAECAFVSYREVAAAKAWLPMWMVALFVSDGFDPEDALPRLPPRPLLVIHSTDDHIVPFELGLALFERAQEPKQFYRSTDSGHFTPWRTGGAEFERMIVKFFSEALR